MEKHIQHDMQVPDYFGEANDSDSENSGNGSEPDSLDADASSVSARVPSRLQRRPASFCEPSSSRTQTPRVKSRPSTADELLRRQARQQRIRELQWPLERKPPDHEEEMTYAHVKRQSRRRRTAKMLLRKGLVEAFKQLDRICSRFRGIERGQFNDEILGKWAEDERSRLSAGKQSHRFSSTSAATTAKRASPSREMEMELLSHVEDGSFRAMSHLGRLYFIQKKYAKSHVLLKRCPEWDLEAQYRMGIMYFDGLEARINFKSAVRCMMRVANADPKFSGIPEQVIRSAQYFLGTAYYGGFGVSGSEEKAVEWWRLASQNGKSNGNVQAQIALGLFYSDPWHKDVKEAFFWHQCADRNGGSASTAPYAVMCQQGLGTKKQPMQALSKLKEAVLKYGSIYAAGNLIAFYFQRKLYKLAAHIATNLLKREHGMDRMYSQVELKGLALAYFYLGRCHQLGLGVRRDEILAMQLFKQAVHMDIEIVHPLYFDWIYGLI